MGKTATFVTNESSVVLYRRGHIMKKEKYSLLGLSLALNSREFVG
jgi:hypothetical protein